MKFLLTGCEVFEPMTVKWLSKPNPEPTTVFFRDDDDINDVASMAGVNLNEENARILATGSELVGTKIRSCKDESFLPAGLLHRRILDTGTFTCHKSYSGSLIHSLLFSSRLDS